MKYLLILSLFAFFAQAKPLGKLIAKIPEASGIDYCSDSGTLIVANDEGTYYELDMDGNVLHRTKLGNYDLEGVVCEEKEIFFAVEDKGILKVRRKRVKKEKLKLDPNYEGKDLTLFNKKAGVEGIAKQGNVLYLSKQSDKKKNSFIVVLEMVSDQLKVIDVIEHRIPDTSGLTIHDQFLYMVSDKKDLLVKYDLQKKKIVKKVKLAKGSWEGITFDDKGFIYLADDDGKVLKYKKKSLGL